MTNLLHTKRVRNKTLLPFSVIHAASQGDEAAICCILKRYEGYIRRLSTRCFYDAAGNLYYFVDEAVRGQLEIRSCRCEPENSARHDLPHGRERNRRYSETERHSVGHDHRHL